MEASTIFLNTTDFLSRTEIIEKLKSPDEAHKKEALLHIISQMSQGKPSNFLHLVIKETLIAKNNSLKRFVYYYMELLPKNKEDASYTEFLVLCNQIRKDLQHPNEFVRGLAIRFVSTLEDMELIDNFYKLIKENTNYPNGYVRRNAYYCLGVIFYKFSIYAEIPELLYNALFRDTDPQCLRQAFVSLASISSVLVEKFAREVSFAVPNDLAEVMMEHITDTKFIMEMFNSPDKRISFYAALALINQKSELKSSVDKLLDSIYDFPEYRDQILDVLQDTARIFSFAGYANQTLDLIDPYSIPFTKKCLNFVFKIAEVHEFADISKILSYRFRDSAPHKLDFKIQLLESMAQFYRIYGMYSEEVIDACVSNVVHENPGLAYASLKLVYVCLETMQQTPCINNGDASVGEAWNKDYNEKRTSEGIDKSSDVAKSKIFTVIDKLVTSFPYIKYGKILRLCFELFSKFGSESTLCRILDVLNESFDAEKKPIFLTSTATFLGSFICIGLCAIEKSADEELKARTIAVMIKFINYGKDSGTLDSSSHSTIISCIRNVASNCSASEGRLPSVSNKVPVSVLEPLNFDCIPACRSESLDNLLSYLSTKFTSTSLENIEQLTGLSDPIYIEASVQHTRFEVTLDLLIINQTESYLQNILFDFTTSKNLFPISINTPYNLPSRSVVSKSASFKISDSSSGFISGAVTFKYPGESGEYSNTVYTLNLSELQTCISDFLEHKSMSNEDFKDLWRSLEWENVYSIKVCTDRSISDVLKSIANKTKASVVIQESGDMFCVANLACATFQGTDILMNLILERGEIMNFECRIRSKREDIVISMSSVIGGIMREARSK